MQGVQEEQLCTLHADYPEDGTKLLNEANLELVKLDHGILKPWLSLLIRDPNLSTELEKNKKN
jgi:hypothetical protein